VLGDKAFLRVRGQAVIKVKEQGVFKIYRISYYKEEGIKGFKVLRDKLL
jgi:hypothetical protein